MYDDAVTPRMLCAGNLQGGVDACQVSAGVSEPSPVGISVLSGRKQISVKPDKLMRDVFSPRATPGARWCVWSVAGGGSWQGS